MEDKKVQICSNFFVQSQNVDTSVRQFLKMIDFGKKYGASVKDIMPDCVDMSFPNKEAMEAYVEGLNEQL